MLRASWGHQQKHQKISKGCWVLSAGGSKHYIIMQRWLDMVGPCWTATFLHVAVAKTQAPRSSRWCFPLWELLDIDISPEFFERPTSTTMDVYLPFQVRQKGGIHRYTVYACFLSLNALVNHHLRGNAILYPKKHHPTERLKIIYLLVEFWHIQNLPRMTWYCPQKMLHIPTGK